MEGCKILDQIWSKLLICPKRAFLAKLTVTIVYLLHSFMLRHFKKSPKSKSCDRMLHNFWLKLGASYFPKRDFFRKVHQHCFRHNYNYCVPSCYVISKKVVSEQVRRIKLHSFFKVAHCPYSEK